MSTQSLLAYLAPRLTSQLENVITEALAYLLRRYEPVRSVFRDHVSQAGVELPNLLKFDTQVTWLDASRPDMVVLDGERRRILIVESKFWAPLTKNQPKAYIQQLAAGKPALLLFIAPKDQLPKYWQQLVARSISDASMQPQEETTPLFRVLILNADSNHRLALTSWEDLFEAFTQHVGDSAALEDIRQLQSLCAGQPWDDSDYKGLVDDLIKRLISDGIVSLEGNKPVRRPTYYKRYLTLKGHANWCVEYNETYFRVHSSSRLWLTKYVGKTLSPQAVALLEKLNTQTVGQSILIPLLIPESNGETVVRDVVLETLHEQIKDIADRLE